MVPLLNELGALVTEDTEKISLLRSLPIRPLGKRVWTKEDLVRDHLGKLDANKSMASDGCTQEC